MNNVYCVCDREQALDYVYQRGNYSDPVKAPRPDMVLLDLKLPKIDGIEVLRQIKEDPSLREIPVVVFTSSTDQRDVHAAYRHYANSYIAKPIDFYKFRKVVDGLGYYWTIFNHPPGLALRHRPRSVLRCRAISARNHATPGIL